MASFSISKPDPLLYKWHASPQDPSLYRRRALGAEIKWVHRASEPVLLYLSGEISFKARITDREFRERAEAAWLQLHFEYPEVVLKPVVGSADDGCAMMECRLPVNTTEAKEWAGRTLSFDVAFGDANERFESAETGLRKTALTDPISLRFISKLDPRSLHGGIAKTKFCFRVDHGCTDGIGTHILAGCYFRLLARELGPRNQEDANWERCVEYLPPPWIMVINSRQMLEGKAYEEGVMRVNRQVIGARKGDWGLKKLPGTNEFMPRSFHRSFSVEQTSAMMRSVKEELGPTSSITSLGHAAMVLTMLKFDKAEGRLAEGRSFTNMLFINGRRHLSSDHLKSNGYVPLCRALGIIEFREIEKCRLSRNPSEGEIQEKLNYACSEAGRSYQIIRDQDSLLTESSAAMENMPSVINEEGEKQRVEPYFLSDGIVEQYIHRVYHDGSEEREMFSVDDVQFTADPDGPALIIRMSNFRDSLRLSAEWNNIWYPEEDVQKFLNSVASLMLTLK